MFSTITKPNYALRDQKGKVTFYVLLWKRKGISLEIFSEYWKNVHGPVCARLPGQHQYWQFHLGSNSEYLLPQLKGIDNTVLPEDQFNGIAELTFASDADRQTWFKTASILMDDEHNIFSKAVGYNTSSGNSLTYIDRLETGELNGELGILNFQIMVKKSETISTDAFRRYMQDTFAASIIQHNSVLKFRLHLFDEVDNSRPDANEVVHNEPPEKQYQAAVEIAFSNPLEMEKFFASQEYAEAVRNQANYVKQISLFPVHAVHTFVYDGKMTLAGERSSAVAELITKIGAINQLEKNIVSLMNGKNSLSNSQQMMESEFSMSNTQISNLTTTQERVLFAENLPGTNVDLVKRLFARGESADSAGFIEFFTDTPVYQFGNFAICFDKAAIKKSADNFNSQVLAVYHDIKMMWEVGDVVFVEMDVYYWRKDGSMVALPCCDIFRVEGDKFSELRIFMDVNPVFDATIAVPSNSSVFTVTQGTKILPQNTMKNFYLEHPEGKQRVATGFAPKWSRFESRWSMSNS